MSIKLTNETQALKVIKLIEIKTLENTAKVIDVEINEKISNFLKENFVQDLTFIEKKNKMKIDIITDSSLIIPEYIIDIKNKSKKTLDLIKNIENLKNLETQKKEAKVINIKERKKFKRKSYKRKSFYKKAK